MSVQMVQMSNLVRETGLVVSGIAPLNETDGLGDQFRSVALFSPCPNTFWSIFKQSEEMKDGKPDPIDRWSHKVVRVVANEIDGLALFPFEGPPYHPFSTWAQRTSVAWQSPSGLLVHAVYGLWISFRGAIALKDPPDAPLKNHISPCEACSRPCLEACPGGALSAAGYDYGSCLSHVQLSGEPRCASFGCIARHACPLGQDFSPPTEQLQLHMKAFAKTPID